MPDKKPDMPFPILITPNVAGAGGPAQSNRTLGISILDHWDAPYPQPLRVTVATTRPNSPSESPHVLAIAGGYGEIPLPGDATVQEIAVFTYDDALLGAASPAPIAEQAAAGAVILQVLPPGGLHHGLDTDSCTSMLALEPIAHGTVTAGPGSTDADGDYQHLASPYAMAAYVALSRNGRIDYRLRWAGQLAAWHTRDARWVIPRVQRPGIAMPLLQRFQDHLAAFLRLAEPPDAVHVEPDPAALADGG